MATERDLELLDDYLSNRMKGQEKLDFEKRLEADSSLQGELGLQKGFIDGIKKARVAELKAMLSEIAVPAPSNTSLMVKAALTIVVVAAVGTGLYFLVDKDEMQVQTEAPKQEKIASQPPNEESDVVENKKNAEPSKDTEVIQKDTKTKAENIKADKKSAVESGPLKQPSVAPYDPTKELEHSDEKPQNMEESTPAVSNSSITVVTDNSDKKLDFHYQFKDGKLFLLGSFEKDLYEILEFFNNNKRTIFLYYNSNYYLLDEGRAEPTPLKAITDQSLLQKLKASRAK
ncbi:MAG TPA: hypothetical protein VFW11_09090 [Cyclobacteriaceae bacterium]|nr:hypothetical protein [Cyclobacteriaceae bacterium]